MPNEHPASNSTAENAIHDFMLFLHLIIMGASYACYPISG